MSILPGLESQVVCKIRFYILQCFLLSFPWNHLCFTQSQASFLYMYDNRVWKMAPYNEKRAENNLQKEKNTPTYSQFYFSITTVETNYW